MLINAKSPTTEEKLKFLKTLGKVVTFGPGEFGYNTGYYSVVFTTKVEQINYLSCSAYTLEAAITEVYNTCQLIQIN